MRASTAGEISKNKIREAFSETQTNLGITGKQDWTRKYYQLANRIAVLYFLNEIAKIPSFLITIFFINDRNRSKNPCPKSDRNWFPAINEEYEYLGISHNKWIERHIKKVFIDVLG